MLIVPLQAIPSQSFSIQLDNSIYNITLRFVVNFMAIDLMRDNVQILSGIRVVPGYPIIPFQYIENGNGNFALITFNNDYPIYTAFNITQFLIYANPQELEVIRATTG